MKDKYLKDRKALIEEAQNLINDGKLEEAAAKRAEIEALDEEFKNKSTEMANLKSLEEVVDVNLENNNVENKGDFKEVENLKVQENNVSYENVFSKAMLGYDLNNDEIAVFNKYNPENVYTHTTLNTEVVIPETTVGQIYDMMKELHPILADVNPTRIKGTVKYPIRSAIAAGDAKYYDEATVTEDEENKFTELVLGGKELAKAVTVTWKLQAMAISEFIPFITRELAERLGAAKANAYIRGKGDTKEPQGVITAITSDENKQKVEVADSLTYANLTAAMALVNSTAVNGAKIYANNATIWSKLAGLLDGQNRPLFIPDVTAGGVGRIFGLPVMQEDAMADGEILIGNFGVGYKDNQQEPMKLVTEQHAKARTTDFVAYEVHDGGVIDTRAFAYLAAAAEPGV